MKRSMLHRFWPVAALLVVSALPIFRDDFLFSDDYYWYDIQHSRPYAADREATQMNISNGRPVHNVFFLAMQPLLEERAGFIPARAIGVAALVVCLALLARLLRRRYDPARANWLALWIMLLPGFVLFAFWLIGVPCLIADMLALVAFIAITREGKANAVAATLSLVIALAAYQPHAMLYFGLVAFWLAYTDDLSLRTVSRPFIAGFAALIVYFPCAQLLMRLYDYGAPGRGEVVIEPLKKLVWLGKDALPFAAKTWSIIGPERPALVIVGFLFLVPAILRQQRPNIWRVALVICALVLTLLPHLVVRETVVRWRVVLPLSVGLVLVWSVVARLERWPLHVLAGVVLLTLVARTFELEHYGVAPERAQVAAVARLLHDQAAAYVVRPTADDAVCVTRVSNDEFTAPSSQHDFVAAGLVRLGAEVGHTRVPPTVTHDNDLGKAPPGAVVLDMRHLEDCVR
jgi:hypothetical protein